jgi:hypothetical protein
MVLEEQPEKVIEALVLFLQGQVSITLNYFALRQNKLERLSLASLFSLAQCLQLGPVSLQWKSLKGRQALVSLD